MSNPYPRAERYRHVAIERLDGWVHSWWVCAHERRLSGAADLRLAASAALRIRAGARAACKRLRGERDEARRQRDQYRHALAELRERFRRVRLPEPLLNGRVVDGGDRYQVALVPPSLMDLSPAPGPFPSIQIATFRRISEATKINGVDVTWTTWRPVSTEDVE